MTLKFGIIGLPNVGKSTLFNAMTSSMVAEASNYPFCTIKPNHALVIVPDIRLKILYNIANSLKIIPASIEIVDIAGLVKGASKGAGLGNKFLSHIREVDAILHVLRCFDDPYITHVHNLIDPLYDADIIETELILKDIEFVEKHLINNEKQLKYGNEDLKNQIALLRLFQSHLICGKPLYDITHFYSNNKLNYGKFLTSKPCLYVCNVLEKDIIVGNKFTNSVSNKMIKENKKYLIISSKIELDISLLEREEEKVDFLNSMGLQKSGCHKIVEEIYNLLNLRTFFTVGPKEIRAWPFISGTSAIEAARSIHSDFKRGFICAEIVSYEDYIFYNGMLKSKEMGKIRLEGKDYKMRDGDIVYFRFNI